MEAKTIINFPKSAKTRTELLEFLGIQGGTCHDLPDLIKINTNGKNTTLITPNYYISIIRHDIGQRMEIFHKYRFSNKGEYSNLPITEEQVAFDACNPQSPKEYINWKEQKGISIHLRQWLLCYIHDNGLTATSKGK